MSDLACLNDTQRIDFLEAKSRLGWWVLRPSTTGRGWRLHEHALPECDAAGVIFRCFRTVREAIDAHLGIAWQDDPRHSRR